MLIIIWIDEEIIYKKELFPPKNIQKNSNKVFGITYKTFIIK